jgi:hypothetical protein
VRPPGSTDRRGTGEDELFLSKDRKTIHIGDLEHARALEDYALGLFSALAGGRLGPFLYRYATPGQL